MVGSCCIKHCHNHSKKGYRLFAIPKRKNALFRKPWLESIGMKEEDLPKDARLCEGHFPIEAFTPLNSLGWLVLKHDAVPSIFGFDLPMTVSSVVRGSEYAPIFQTPDGNWVKERPFDLQPCTYVRPIKTEVISKAQLISDHQDLPTKRRKLVSKYNLEERTLGVAFIRRETCCISGCDSTAKSSITNERHFLPFPTEKNLRNEWIENIRLMNGSDWIPRSCSFVCPVHFKENDWKNENGLQLKSSAVPLLLTLQKQNNNSDAVCNNKSKVSSQQVCDEEKLKSTSQSVVSDHSYSDFMSVEDADLSSDVEEDLVRCTHGPINTSDNMCRRDESEIIECIVSDESDNEKDKPVDTDFDNCLQDVSGKIKSREISRTSNVGILKDTVSNLILNSQSEGDLEKLGVGKQLTRLKRENRVMKKELIKIIKLVETMRHSDLQLRIALQKTSRKNKELLKYEEYLKKMFNPDQILCISRGSLGGKGMKWSDETIKECTWLKTKCGKSAYIELANRLPLPSIVTLNRFKKSKLIKKESESIPVVSES